MTQLRRILFVELLGGLGDVVLALPAIQALARSEPHATLEVATFAPAAELLAHDPHVDAVHVVPRSAPRAGIATLLAAEGYDLVVSTTDYDGIGALIAAAAPRAVIDLWRDPPAGARVTDRFVALLAADRLIDADVIAPAELFLTAAEHALGRATVGRAPVAALLIDAGMAIKRWPEARFADVGRMLSDRHGLAPLVIGGADAAAAARVADAAGGRVLPPMPLRDLAAVLAHVRVAVGADTGPLRVAALAGTPSVMLFGPSSSARFGLEAPHRDVQARADCPEKRTDFTQQRCWYAGDCPLPTGPASCVTDIDAATVAEAVASVLPRHAEPEPCHGTADRAADWAADWADARRILVLRLDNIGDVLMTAPALRAIRLGRPEACIGLLASPSGVEAAALLPWLDRAEAARTIWQELDPGAFDRGAETALVARLRAGAWDGAIVLTSFAQSPHAAAEACRAAGIARIAGASDERSRALTHRLPKGDRTLHQTTRNLALVRALGFAGGDDAPSLTVPAAPRLRHLRGHLLVSPWASAAARQYDPARMAEAATRIARARGLPVVVTGGPSDRVRGAALAARIPGARDLTGETSVAEAAALVAQAALVLCCNSSAMHMAEALGVPSIVLFAGTELARQWAPRRAPHRLVRRSVPCAPCHAMTCPLGHHACLDIEAADVAAAAADLLTPARAVS